MHSRSKLTTFLIFVNVTVYIFSALLSHNFSDMNNKVLVEMGALFGPFVVLKGEWWRLLSAMFLHGGITHILMNMFSLYIVGRGVALYFDTKSYLALYFFSGIYGGLISLLVHPVSVGVGASGAIFGVFGALAGFFLAHKARIARYAQGFMREFGTIIGINLLFGMVIPSVDVSAHIGGVLVGFLGGFVLAKNPKWFMLYMGSMMSGALLLGFYLVEYYAQIRF